MTISVTVKATGHVGYVFEGKANSGEAPKKTIVDLDQERTFSVHGDHVVVVSEEDMMDATQS